MRGTAIQQMPMLSTLTPDQLIPQDHPIRRIKPIVETVLASMDATFDEMYAELGRTSIPPEHLLKATVLMAMYSMRSERQFCERLQYDLLFKWFLDLNVDDRGFEHSTFAKNRERLLEHKIADAFFAAVVQQAKLRRYISDEHFTVDGTLLEAWASTKSFRPRDTGGGGDGGGSNPDVNFHASGSGLLNGLQAYWKFDDGSGTSVSDATDNGNTATWNGTLGSQWTTGKINGAGNFNGTDNYVSVPNSTSLDSPSTAITISTWVYPTAFTGNNNYAIVDKNDFRGYMLDFVYGNNGSAQLEFAVAGEYDVPVYASLRSNAWYHIAAVYDSTTSRLYVNGTQVASASRAAAIVPGSGSLVIGSRDGAEKFQGTIDELSVWNRALSANEVTDLYNAGNGNQYPFPALTTDTVTITSGTLGFGTARVASNVTSTQAFSPQMLSGLDITDNGSNFQVDMNDATGTGTGWKVTAKTTTDFANGGTSVPGLLPTFEAVPGARLRYGTDVVRYRGLVRLPD